MHKGYGVAFIVCMGMVGYGFVLLHQNQGTGLEGLNAIGIAIWIVCSFRAFQKTFKKN
jgi:hypothetical protein